MTTDFEHVAWACRKCNKVDWKNIKIPLAQPEHDPYRGADIGTCKGRMVKLYSKIGGDEFC